MDMWDQDQQETDLMIAGMERMSQKNALIGTFARHMMPYLKEQYPEVYADLILRFGEQHDEAITECHKYEKFLKMNENK